MNARHPTFALVTFVAGLAAGAGGLALVQHFAAPSGDPRDAANAAAAEARSAAEEPARLQAEIGRLRAELARRDASTRGAGGETPDPEAVDSSGAEPAVEEAKEPTHAVVDLMFEMGRAAETQKVETLLAGLVDRLALNDSQADVFRTALIERNEARLAAARRIMTGTATVADLAAADEDNFAEFDRLVGGVLDESQAAAFAEFRNEREFERVERKTTEDLEGLKRIADLTPAQEEAAWEVFAAAHAEQPPGAVPPDLDIEAFAGFVDGEIDKRVEGLRPILETDQLDAYRSQTETFRTMVLTMVGFATGSGDGADPGR